MLIAFELRDVKRIEKLMKITSVDGYWDKVRKLCSNVCSDHAIKRWQCLAEERYEQLRQQSK